MPLVIYDTGIIIQATITPFSLAECALQLIEDDTVVAVMSNRLRAEYEDVLRRLAALQKYAKSLQGTIVGDQLARIDALIERLSNAPEQIEYPRDPDDAPTINLAIYVGADFIVARDNDLLVLDADPTFRKRSPQTRILDPVAFLREIELWMLAGNRKAVVPLIERLYSEVRYDRPPGGNPFLNFVGDLVIRDLIRSGQEAQTHLERTMTLRALGRLGDRRAETAIRPFLQVPDEKIRGAAQKALADLQAP